MGGGARSALLTLHNNLGVASSTIGETRRASPRRKHLRQAVALRPTYALSHLNLGSVALLRGRYVEAEAALRRFLQQQPDAPEGAERLAVLHILQGRTDEAIRSCAAPGVSRSRRRSTRSRDRVTLIRMGDLRFLGQALLEQAADDAVLPSRARCSSILRASFRFWLAHAYRGRASGTGDGEFAALRRLNPKATAPTAVR